MASLTASAARAQSVRLVLPPCAEGARFVELLALELVSARLVPDEAAVERTHDAGPRDGVLELSVFAEACDPRVDRIGFTLRRGRHLAEGYVALAASDGDEVRARVLALALAERARLFRTRVEAMERAPPDEPRVDDPPPRWLELVIPIHARVFVGAPTGLLGARLGVALRFAPFVVQLDVGADGSLVERTNGRLEAWLATLAIAAGARLDIGSGWAFELFLRGELGPVVASGTPLEGPARTMVAPWASLGLGGAVLAALADVVAIRAGARLDAAVLGLVVLESDGVALAIEGMGLALELGVVLSL